MQVSPNYQVRNPATGEVVGYTQFATVADLKRYIESARVTQRIWKELPFAERARVIRRFHVEELLAIPGISERKWKALRDKVDVK